MAHWKKTQMRHSQIYHTVNRLRSFMSSSHLGHSIQVIRVIWVIQVRSLGIGHSCHSGHSGQMSSCHPPSPLISLNTKAAATNIHRIAFVSKIVSSLRSLLSLLTPLTIPLLLKKLKIPSQWWPCQVDCRLQKVLVWRMSQRDERRTLLCWLRDEVNPLH